MVRLRTDSANRSIHLRKHKWRYADLHLISAVGLALHSPHCRVDTRRHFAIIDRDIGDYRYRFISMCIYFENRFPVLFEPFSLKHVYEDIHEYDMVDYGQADQSVVNFLKYLTNFAFYRFGLEVRSTAYRLDRPHPFFSNRSATSPRWSSLVFVSMWWPFSTLYWLGLFLISSRRTIQRLWPIYIFFQIIAFPVQYMSVVGAPPFLCFGKTSLKAKFVARWFSSS